MDLTAGSAILPCGRAPAIVRRQPTLYAAPICLSLPRRSKCRRRAGRRHRGGRRRGLPFNARAGRRVSADTWAVVDGHEIKRDDVDKAFRRSRRRVLDALGRGNAARQAEPARRADHAAGAAVEGGGAQDRGAADASSTPPTPRRARTSRRTRFQQELVQRGLTAADMREGLRRELLAQKVIEQEVDVEDRGDRQGRHRLLQRQPRAVQRARGVVSPRADRHHAGARRPGRPTAPATTRPRRRRPRRRCRC